MKHKSKSKAIWIVLVGMVAMTSWCGMVRGEIIPVNDDFSGASLDTSVWQTFTSDDGGTGTVTQEDGHLKLYAGGSLVTVNDYTPQSGQDITVTGRLTTDTASDRMFFYSHGGYLGQRANSRHGGVRWFFLNVGGALSLDGVTLENGSAGSVSSSTVNTLSGTDTSTIYDFTWITGETGATFDLSVADGAGSGTMSVSAEFTDIDFGHSERYIIFQNNTGTPTMSFDNISITAIPEPSSLALLGLAGLMLIRRWHRA